MAQRQSLRATDENLALARAEGRPQIDTSAGFNQDVVTRNLGSNQRDFSASATATDAPHECPRTTAFETPSRARACLISSA